MAIDDKNQKKGTLTLNKSSLSMPSGNDFIKVDAASGSRVVRVVRKNRAPSSEAAGVSSASEQLANSSAYDKRKKVLDDARSLEFQEKETSKRHENQNIMSALQYISNAQMNERQNDNAVEELISAPTNEAKQLGADGNVAQPVLGDSVKNSEDAFDNNNPNFLRDAETINGTIGNTITPSLEGKDAPKGHDHNANAQKTKVNKKLPFAKKPDKGPVFSKKAEDAALVAAKKFVSKTPADDSSGLKSWRSNLDHVDLENERVRVRELFSRRQTKKVKKGIKNAATTPRLIPLSKNISVASLAHRMSIKSAQVLRVLRDLGINSKAEDELTADDARMVIEFFGHKAEYHQEVSVESVIAAFDDNEANMRPCSPVVTVMGHVDHGKTSLLDALRNSSIAATEVGGITQKTMAYQVKSTTGKLITFIDTPGHEAFAAMRVRGAMITDIVVLVIAADDGVMPQTIEAIGHVKAANVPMVVAINKIDKPGANIKKILADLIQHGVVVEEMGGDVLCVGVSALKSLNLDQLEEIILLQAEISSLSANYDRPANGVVLESRFVAGYGPCISVLVKGGTLRKGDVLVTGNMYGVVKSMIAHDGTKIDNAIPATPVDIVGLGGIPDAGEKFVVVPSQRVAKEIVNNYKLRSAELAVRPEQLVTDNFFTDSNRKILSLIIKADTFGACDAISNAITVIKSEEIEVNILHSTVGDINESDVLLATVSNASIVGFNVAIDAKVANIAKARNVNIKICQIIYEMIDYVKELISQMLSPALIRKHLGSAQVRKVFVISKSVIAGSYVIEGVVKRNAEAEILRKGVCIYTGKIKSLRRAKDDVAEVGNGFECGIVLDSYSAIEEGDVIKAYETIRQKRTIA